MIFAAQRRDSKSRAVEKKITPPAVHAAHHHHQTMDLNAASADELRDALQRITQVEPQHVPQPPALASPPHHPPPEPETPPISRSKSLPAPPSSTVSPSVTIVPLTQTVTAGQQKLNALVSNVADKVKTRMGSTERVCCCHVITAAALVGMLQLTIVVMTMASSGIVLDRWRVWEAEEKSNRERGPMPEPEPEPEPEGEPTVHPYIRSILNNLTTREPDTEPETWSEAFVELELAQQLGFCAVWLVSLFIYGASFKSYKPVMVLPNLFMLIIGTFLTLMGFVALVMRLTDVDKGYRTDDYEEAIFAYMAGFTLLFFFMELIFIFVVYKFFKFMKEASGLPIAPPADEKAWA